MDCLIITVNGKSMTPFLVSEELLLVEKKRLPLSCFKKGECILIDNNLHRYIGKNKVKGDRLIYSDMLLSHEGQRPIGRIYTKNNFYYQTHFSQLHLILIGNVIAYFSNLNVEKNKFRFLNLAFIIFFSILHRQLERINSKPWIQST